MDVAAAAVAIAVAAAVAADEWKLVATRVVGLHPLLLSLFVDFASSSPRCVVQQVSAFIDEYLSLPYLLYSSLYFLFFYQSYHILNNLV